MGYGLCLDFIDAHIRLNQSLLDVTRGWSVYSFCPSIDVIERTQCRRYTTTILSLMICRRTMTVVYTICCGLSVTTYLSSFLRPLTSCQRLGLRMSLVLHSMDSLHPSTYTYTPVPPAHRPWHRLTARVRTPYLCRRWLMSSNDGTPLHPGHAHWEGSKVSFDL